MAVNLLSDELKSDITYLVLPITKEQIVKTVNALIYHFKTFKICFENDIVYPSGVDYLASTGINTILVENYGSNAEEYINKLEYLYIPLEINDIIDQINLIIDILQSKNNISGGVVSSYFFEILKNDIYEHTSSIRDRNGFSALNYSNDLNSRIDLLQKITLPTTYGNIIETLNSIVNLFKTNARIVDPNDIKLLIHILKREEIEGFGGDYGNATTTPYEFQANVFISSARLYDSGGYGLLDVDENILFSTESA